MSLLAKWSNLLQKRQWSFITNDKKCFLMMNVAKDGVTHQMKIQFKEEANIVIATVSYKRKVPAEQRTAIVEFINQINIEISIGGFEMDRRDGEIRFRHSIDVEGLNCTEIFAHNFVNSVAMTGCKYYNALCSVMDGKVQEAYSMI